MTPGGTIADDSVNGLSGKNSPHNCNPNKKESTSWRNGYSCGWWILRYQNMNYLRMSEQEIADNW